MQASECSCSIILLYRYTVVIIARGQVNNHSTLSNTYCIIYYCIIYIYYTPWPLSSVVVRVHRSYYFYSTILLTESVPPRSKIFVSESFFSPRPVCDLRIPSVRISFIVLHVELFDLCSSGAVLMDFFHEPFSPSSFIILCRCRYWLLKMISRLTLQRKDLIDFVKIVYEKRPVLNDGAREIYNEKRNNIIILSSL